jgi:hypothetical protein
MKIFIGQLYFVDKMEIIQWLSNHFNALILEAGILLKP